MSKRKRILQSTVPHTEEEINNLIGPASAVPTIQETAVINRPIGGVKNLLFPHAQSLAGDFWPDQQPVMVGSFSHFAGDYPNPDHKRTCKTRWVISGEGQTAVKFAPVDFSQWRGYATKAGHYMPACPHCQHERIMDFSQRIEKASGNYAGANLMRWAELPNSEVKSITAKLRKRRERGDLATNYTTFPLNVKQTILLHDAGDIDGRELPTDRAGLYNLVSQWVLNTPKGKRAGHGLMTWGKLSGDDNQNEDDAGEAAPAAGGDKPKRWRIIGLDYLKALNVMAGYLDENPTVKGLKFKVDIGDVLKCLDAAGLDYAIDGTLPEDVTLSVCKPEDTYTKCDTEGGHREEKPEKPLDFSALDGARGVWR